jgi:hypothetical protein
MQNTRTRTRWQSEEGMTLLATVMVMMLMSALLVGFVSLVMADQQASGLNRDQTQAYAAAHAGLEKLTADLGDLFVGGNFNPTRAELDGLEAEPPVLDGFAYETPGGGSGYRINAGAVAARPVPSGPYQGLVGLITPYEVTVTARSTTGGEVRMRRQMQTVGIPVFQFGIFSENDLAFFAGPNFNFGGRVHTNASLFLKQDGTATLTLSDRVTAVGEVIRTHLQNGVSGTHQGNVRVNRNPGGTASYRNLGPLNCTGAACEGSVVGGPGSAANEPAWTNLSVGTYNRSITNGRTGARRLDLPLVSDGALPIDIIRRPNPAAPDSAAVAQQRFFHMASVRILLSDTRDDIMNLASVDTSVEPIALESLAAMQTAGYNYTNTQAQVLATGRTPLAVAGSATTPASYIHTAGTSLIGGFLKIERQDAGGDFHDVTAEVLNLGFSGRNLSTGAALTRDNGNCSALGEASPNAIIRLQRLKDTPAAGQSGANTLRCGNGSTNGTDYWPNVLYDPREGAPRDDEAFFRTQPYYHRGIMHYVELDVNNLKRWLEGAIGTTGDDDTMRETGYVVYFSDRRTNRDFGPDGVAEIVAPFGDDRETGEFGWENFVNSTAARSDTYGVFDTGEDVNGNGTQQTYGQTPRYVGIPNPTTTNAGTFGSNARPWTQLTTWQLARANRPVFFRRALKLVNGARNRLPFNGSQGLTVASENPVYIQGNFNACTWNDTPGTCTETGGAFGPTGNGHVSAAVIADAVTLLSNSWNDIGSFINPHSLTHNTAGTATAQRNATTTWYRLAVIAGKGIPFPRPTNNTGADHQDYGTDGGAHNFLRYIENWDGQALNYRGSIVSFYTSRQAVGTYKCCDVVYGAPSRGYNFDAEFLSPPLLPPRTPMFRDINTLTFRQLLRPTQ